MKTTTKQRVEIANPDNIKTKKDRVIARIAIRDNFSRRMERASALSARLEKLRQKLLNQRVEIAYLESIKPAQDRVIARIALWDNFSRRMERSSALSARLEDMRRQLANQNATLVTRIISSPFPGKPSARHATYSRHATARGRSRR